MWRCVWMRMDMFCLRLSGITLTRGERPIPRELLSFSTLRITREWAGCRLCLWSTGRFKVSSWYCVTCRMALCLDGEKRFCSKTQHLLGKEATKRRHLRRMGYELVQVRWRHDATASIIYTCKIMIVWFWMSSFRCRSLTLNLRSWELWRNRCNIFTTRSFPPSSSSITDLQFA